MPGGMNRIARNAKKGNRCRGWRPTTAGRGGTGNSETRNSELDNTNGTINVAFRNDVRRAARRRYTPLFPTGSYNCLPSFSGARCPGESNVVSDSTLPGVFNGNREIETGRVRERETERRVLVTRARPYDFVTSVMTLSSVRAISLSKLSLYARGID